MKKLFLGGFILGIFALLLYSYTQVDLSLTLSRASIFQTIEKGFQYIGYFNRPLSTSIYCSIIGLLFLCYFGVLYITKKKQLTLKNLWVVIGIASILLTVAYNAFSYDLFNYIFAAKVLLHYHQNPYLVHALDFPKDPMLSFMHWTHSPYAYGPLALGITLPFYLLGFGFFLPTFFLFKILSTICFIGSVYFFQKIARKVTPENELFAVAAYALNPLIIIEFLVSAHNDVIMMFLAFLGLYLVLQKKWVWGVLAIVASALTKEVTAVLLLPTIVYFMSIVWKKNFFSTQQFIWVSIISLLAGYLYVISKLGIQPWYILWVLPFVFLIKGWRSIFALSIGFSLGMLLRYVPFLWQGDWNGMAPVVMSFVTIVTPLVFLAFAGLSALVRQKA